MSESLYLAHHGTKGMKWYQRLYQNKDGSLTELGRIHYGVGSRREKAEKVAKLARKTTGKVVKKTASNIAKSTKKNVAEMRKIRREAVSAAKKRSNQIKIESAKRKEQRAKEKAERLAKKIKAQASKKKISDLKAELDEALMNDRRRKVARLMDKQDRIREKAFLKEKERALKKEMKDVQKDAEKEAKKRFSRNKIKSLSDEELQARITRLKNEASLVSLEVARSHPAAKYVADKLLEAGTEAVKGLAKDTITKYGKQMLGLTDVPEDSAKSRTEKMRDAINEIKVQREFEDLVSGRTAKEDELAREAKRYQNLQSIANAKKSIANKPSAEETTKEQARRITERKENERRVKAYRKREIPWAEIAKRMGMTESQVKDLYDTSGD